MNTGEPRPDNRSAGTCSDVVGRREAAWLAPYAFFSSGSGGRRHPEPCHPYRGPFQRDRDRIVHSAAFRRLSGKMQVFTGDMGDYHRTRLTHTMEVASIARTMGRYFRLNEDLIEALALLHDLGHPPFGHAGEAALDAGLRDEGGFSHNQFALTLVEELEQRYQPWPGLNLSHEVLSGQLARTRKAAGDVPLLEVQVVDLADSATYNAHDVDDALQLELVTLDDLAQLPLVQRALDRDNTRSLPLTSQRPAVVHALIDLQVTSVLERCGPALLEAGWTSHEQPAAAGFRLELAEDLQREKGELEAFLYRRVYRHDKLLRVREKAQEQIRTMLDWYGASASRLPEPFRARAERVGARRSAADYLACMTDRSCRQAFAARQSAVAPRTTPERR